MHSLFDTKNGKLCRPFEPTAVADDRASTPRARRSDQHPFAGRDEFTFWLFMRYGASMCHS
jgi:hypothetical protein